MDWLAKASLFLLLPTLLVAYFMFVSLQVSGGEYILWTGDFVGCHSRGAACGYLPGVDAATAPWRAIIAPNAVWGMFILIVIIWLPFTVLWHLTRDWANCALYFYATGIPYWLVWGGLLPQALVLAISLMTVACPVLVVGAFPLAIMTHSMGGFSVLLGFVTGLWIWKRRLQGTWAPNTG